MLCSAIQQQFCSLYRGENKLFLILQGSNLSQITILLLNRRYNNAEITYDITINVEHCDPFSLMEQFSYHFLCRKQMNQEK